MTIEFSCSHCNKVLKTSDDKAGRRAKCPQCGEPIDVPLSAEVTSSDDGFDEPESKTPVSEEQSFLADSPVREEDSFLSQGNTDCPMCGASVPGGASKCQACGETLKASGKSGHWEPRIINIGDVFSRSWGLFKSNLGMCLATSFLAFVIYVVVIIAVVVGSGVLVAMLGNDFAIIAKLLINIVIYFVVFMLQLGVQKIFLQITRGEPTEISTLFSGGPYLWRMLLCTFIFGIVTLIGYVFLIIPGIILALMYWPYSFLLIDRDLPGIQSFTESKKATQGNLLNLFGIYLATIGIFLIGGIVTLGIGFIFLFPFMILVQTVTYAEMTSQ
ncbi:MAG: hypothetical protein QM501_14590 [Gimesia sp.]